VTINPTSASSANYSVSKSGLSEKHYNYHFADKRLSKEQYDV
jgi:hypothetical protein